MIGTTIARVLEKIHKVRKQVADEASEQRGSYSKVNRGLGYRSRPSSMRHPKQGTRIS